MRPVTIKPQDLAHFMREVADEIDHDGSDEGTISWAIPGLGEWPVPEDQIDKAIADHRLFVTGVIRNGNDLGQGGMWVLGELDEGPTPVAIEHAAEVEPPAAQQVTEARRRDIRARMVSDMSKEEPLVSIESIERLADHGMFYVEHLLAELEAKQ